MSAGFSRAHLFYTKSLFVPFSIVNNFSIGFGDHVSGKLIFHWSGRWPIGWPCIARILTPSIDTTCKSKPALYIKSL